MKKHAKHHPSKHQADLQHLQGRVNELEEQVCRLMSTAAELTQAISELNAAVTDLENKPDTTPGAGSLITQAELDANVAGVNEATVRIKAETDKK